MLRRVLISAVAAAMLAGCGQKANDVRLSIAQNELRSQCAGNDTYNCRDMTVDFNIRALELTDFKDSDAETTITKLYGDKGWDLYQKVADEFVEEYTTKFDEMRPNIFARWFLGDNHPPSPKGHVLQMLPSDIASAYPVILKRFRDRAQVAGLKLDQDAQKALAGTSTKGSAASAPQAAAANNEARGESVTAPQENASAETEALNAAVTEYIGTLDKDGGEEYLEGRHTLRIDFNADKHLDAAVVYTIEGSGGAQNGYQTLVGFVYENGKWRVMPGSAVINGSVQSMTNGGWKTVLVDALTSGPDDPDCCPSVQNQQKYVWDGTRFVDVTGLKISGAQQ
ncbi:hypothetical protein [Pseudomonas helleri]|uniref:hypothetical protein n=2 Tax=Pseudomonas helleri TaxID=1608996 RepID=UPI003FD09112